MNVEWSSGVCDFCLLQLSAGLHSSEGTREDDVRKGLQRLFERDEPALACEKHYQGIRGIVSG